MMTVATDSASATFETPWKTTLLFVLLFIATSISLFYALVQWIQLWRRFRQTAAAVDIGVGTPTPHVTILIICSCNNEYEPMLVQETIRRACTADWHQDLLSVQVLDDSSDSSAVIEDAVAHWSAEGVDISRRTRPSREGDKMGNLMYHLPAVTSEFVAIFVR